MPIRIPDALPATEVLESENIFVMTEYRAMHQDIRPLDVLILNLMPTKIVTETQFLRKLSNTPLQIEVEFLRMASHSATHVDSNHLETFYVTFDQIKNRRFDGMIITGAPLEHVEYEEVDYWKELEAILEWSKTHVHCTLHSCWGAFAGLYYHYGIDKIPLPEKLSGIYAHKIVKKTSPLFRGFDDVFYAPHSRKIEITEEQAAKVPQLELMAVSDEAGVSILKTTDSSQFYVFCHPEYDAETLRLEYERDVSRGLEPQVPVHYFPEDDPGRSPIVNWRSAGQLLISNWLNYYVYQSTPYDLTNYTKDA